jgi:hypothetical protein
MNDSTSTWLVVNPLLSCWSIIDTLEWKYFEDFYILGYQFLKVNRRFGETRRLHLQDLEAKQEWRWQAGLEMEPACSSIASVGSQRTTQRYIPNKLTPRPESVSEIYRPSDSILSAKFVLTSADRGWYVVSATDPHGSILGFLDRSRYVFFTVAPQLYSVGWVDPAPEPLLPENLVAPGIEPGPLDL